MGKRHEQSFREEAIQMADTPMKSSASLAIRETQNKTMVKYFAPSIIMSFILGHGGSCHVIPATCK